MTTSASGPMPRKLCECGHGPDRHNLDKRLRPAECACCSCPKWQATGTQTHPSGTR